MSALGALLVLWGAGGLYVLRRRQDMLPLRLGRALLEDLAVLRRQICLCRAPLPAILAKELCRGPGAQALWESLARRLERAQAGEGVSLSRCWTAAVRELPQPLGELLAPLGPLLPAGGGALARAIDETREELTRYLRREQERQSMAARLTAAACLSGAALVILVLI